MKKGVNLKRKILFSPVLFLTKKALAHVINRRENGWNRKEPKDNE